MDPTTAAGIAVAFSKLALFAALVWQSRRATAAVRAMEAEKAARMEADAAVASEPAPARAPADAPRRRIPEPA